MLSWETLQEIIRRIMEVAQPERIILFGSAARGEMGPNSDVDLLVVKSGEFDASRLLGDIYMNLHRVGQAVDVILVTPEQVERYRRLAMYGLSPWRASVGCYVGSSRQGNRAFSLTTDQEM